MAATTILVIMRHAKACPADPGTGDFDRPLAERGLADARRMGQWLAARAPGIERVIFSPALRTRQSAELMMAQWPPATRPMAIPEPALYLAGLPELLGAISEHLPATTAIVGHNPGLEYLLTHLLPDVAKQVADRKIMPTAAVYILEVAITDGRIVAGTARLVDQARPARDGD